MEVCDYRISFVELVIVGRSVANLVDVRLDCVLKIKPVKTDVK